MPQKWGSANVLGGSNSQAQSECRCGRRPWNKEGCLGASLGLDWHRVHDAGGSAASALPTGITLELTRRMTSPSDPFDRLTAFVDEIHQRLVEELAKSGSPRALPQFRRVPDWRPPVGAWEADWFMRGLGENFTVELRAGKPGYVTSKYQSRALVDARGRLLSKAFCHSSGRVDHEEITAFAFLTFLLSEVGLDVEQLRNPQNQVPEFDLLIYDVPWRLQPAASPVVAVEVKASDPEIDHLFGEMNTCGGRGSLLDHEGSGDNAENHHRKCLGMLRVQPSLLWLVAPVHRRLFEAHYDDGAVGRFTLKECDSELPRIAVALG